MLLRLLPPLAVPLLLVSCSRSGLEADIDPGLMTEINRIKLIDQHGHPLAVPTRGQQPDSEYDALAFEDMEAEPMPVRIRDDNREYIAAWKLLYDYRFDDMSEAHVNFLLDSKRARIRQLGEDYPTWVLDRLGIDILLANRVSMGRGLKAPRFRWIPFADALLLPFPDERAKAENPDYRAFYHSMERLFRRYLSELGLTEPPLTLDTYTSRVVTPLLERWKQHNAVAIKLETAYLRSVDFENIHFTEAAALYDRARRGEKLDAVDYKLLQDFLMRFISSEAGRLQLPVQIHLCVGAGSYFKLGAAHPILLDPVLNDPSLRNCRFVLLHGGWPYTREVGALLNKPNVWTDFSAMSFILYPREISTTLRYWLELFPEHVVYGGDAEPFLPQINWEETGWLTATTGRKALALALTGMMRDGEISRKRALDIAHMVLRRNAIHLYGLE